MPVSDWQNEERKHKCAIFAKKDDNHTTAWQIDSREKLLIEINKDPEEVLTIILDLRNIYTTYLN